MQPMPKINPSARQQFDLTDRVAVIPGGAGFLGVQFAEAVAEFGAIPILLDLDPTAIETAVARLKQSGFERAEGLKLDITDEQAVRDTVDRIMSLHGRIDVLINTAALTKYTCDVADPKAFFAPFVETETRIWDQWLKVNLTAVAVLCRTIGPIMVRQGRGSIINIASEAGVISPDLRIYDPDDRGYQGVDFTLPAFYAVSKAGVIHLSRYLATLWAPHNVRVNAFSPAGVYRGHDPGFVRQLAHRIPMGRMAAENEYKGAIVFMASDASSFMTGHNLIIDGGRTVW
jgi:NAD(P)-dependent dehydrogenase (short-subunit alcohol dehydrogenase family)